jgi:hypothetical protein
MKKKSTAAQEWEELDDELKEGDSNDYEIDMLRAAADIFFAFIPTEKLKRKALAEVREYEKLGPFNT